MFAVGDVVEVVRTIHCHQYKGGVGVVTKIKPSAWSRNGPSPYIGFCLSPEMKNGDGLNIAWRAEQLRKINPPDVDLKVKEEMLA